MKISGIYKIINKINSNFYIGSSTDIQSRWYRHKLDLMRGVHPNKHLQNSWNKYGKDNFEFSIIELCNINECIKREQYYIDTLHPEYNILQIAGSSIGYKHTPQELERLSNRKMGNKNLLGFIFSEESKIKMSESHKGKKLSEETRQKMRDSHSSPEARQQMSKANTGRKRSLESRLKQSATLLLRKLEVAFEKDK